MDGTLAAGSGAMRGHNLALVLRLIADEGPVSRVELAARTGLTKATVSSLVSELIEAVLVRDIGPAGAVTTGGRPATLLEPSNLGPVAVGLQLDIDHVAGCLLDLSGRVRARELRRLHAATLSPRDVTNAVRPMLGRLIAAAVDAGRLVAGVGVAVPAVVESSRDDDAPVVAWAPGFGWRDVDLRTLLSGTLTSLGAAGLDIHIGNDTAYAARAEYRASGLDVPLTVYVGGESEIGAAVLVNGVVSAGARIGGSAFGHVPLRPRGPRCACGARGCLDRYAGRAALRTAAGLPDEPLTRMTTGPRVPVALTTTDQGHHALTTAADALSDALGPVIATLDPDRLIIAGRLGGLGPAFLDPLTRNLTTFTPGLTTRPAPTLATLGPDAPMRGAALAITDHILTTPQTWITEMNS